jgi:hypothetical protein
MGGLIICLIIAIICGCIADSKGRNGIGWALFGFFLPIVALIVVLFISDLNEENKN